MKKQDALKDLLDADIDDLLSGRIQEKKKHPPTTNNNASEADQKGWKAFLNKDLFGRKGNIEVQPELGLTLPRTSTAHPPTLLTPELLEESLAAMANMPLKLLPKATNYLRVLNQYLAKPELRLALAETTLVYISALAGKLHLYFTQQDSGVPEPEDRHKLLTKSIVAIHEATISYMQLFKQDFELSAKAFAKVQDRFLLAGVRILELMRIEQQLRALRYQRLAPTTWTQCNHIYFLLIEKGVVEQEATLLRCPNFSGGAAHRQAHVLGEKGTAKQLFASIQLWGLMDSLLWRQQFTTVIDSYLQATTSPYQILADDGRSLGNYQVISYQEQSSPPRFDRVGATGRAAVIMDFSALYDQLQKDYDTLTQHGAKENIPIPLQALDGHNRITVNQLMQYRLCRHTRRNARTASDGLAPYGMHVGFDNCIAAYQAAKKPLRVDKEKQPKTHPRPWHMVDDSAKGIKLVVDQETQLAEPMSVGQLVVFWAHQRHIEKLQMLNNEEEIEDFRPPEMVAAADAEEKELIQSPWLEHRAKTARYLKDAAAAGYILRIERTQEHLEMVIVKLSMEADYVQITDPSKPQSRHTYNGLFMTTLAEEWLLAVSPDPIFEPDTSLVMHRDSERIALELEEIRLSTDEFLLFKVSVYT